MIKKNNRKICNVIKNQKEAIISGKLDRKISRSRKFMVLTPAIIGAFFFIGAELRGQMPSFFGTPPVTAPAPKQPPTSAPVNPSAEKDLPQGSSPASSAIRLPGIPLYDPTMDNHLKSPAMGKEIGLFGKPIKEVEEYMRFLGAKNHSYAFGKYSRMTLSIYLVTLYFDRERKLGGFAVEPRPPYKVIGPDARKYFLEVFVGENDLSRFDSVFASGRLELRYVP